MAINKYTIGGRFYILNSKLISFTSNNLKMLFKKIKNYIIYKKICYLLCKSNMNDSLTIDQLLDSLGFIEFDVMPLIGTTGIKFF